MDNKKEETIEMPEKIINETTTETLVNTTTTDKINPRDEFEEYIDKIAENAFNTFSECTNNLEDILDIAQKNNYYYLNHHIGYHDIKNIIITNVKSALKSMYREYELGKECFGYSYSGHFKVVASYNESDGDNIVEINIMFIPYSSYEDADLKEMKRLYHKTYNNTK